MGERITLVPAPVESGGRYPPSLFGSRLNSGAKIFGRPTDSISLHPPILHRACNSPPLSRVLCTRSTSPAFGRGGRCPWRGSRGGDGGLAGAEKKRPAVVSGPLCSGWISAYGFEAASWAAFSSLARLMTYCMIASVCSSVRMSLKPGMPRWARSPSRTAPFQPPRAFRRAE